MASTLLSQIKEIISAGDLRNIDQSAASLHVKFQLRPYPVYVEGHAILGWVDLVPIDPPAFLAPGWFNYSIAIQDAVDWKWRPQVIARMDFLSIAKFGCIEQSMLYQSFGTQAEKTAKTDAGGYSLGWKVWRGRNYEIVLGAGFDPVGSCVKDLLLTQVKTRGPN